MASISSMKMMAGARFLASVNRLRTRDAPKPPGVTRQMVKTGNEKKMFKSMLPKIRTSSLFPSAALVALFASAGLSNRALYC